MFEHVLRLSKVDGTQSVAVAQSSYSNPRLVNAAMAASQRLKAKVYGVVLPAFNHP
jgi:2,5-dihydroxypyridine 5,6-dioxygenase